MYKLRRRPVSLFATQTFKVALLAFVSGVSPILIRAAYSNNGISVDDAIACAALLTTFFTALVGRVDTNPVYTPDGIPGPNKGQS